MTIASASYVAVHAAATAAPAVPAPKAAPPGPTDAARFGHALASAPALPEHHLLSAAGKLAGHSQHLVQRVTADDRAVGDPVHLLAMQRHLTERVLALEFVAKVAGASTQGINKLVHMQ